MKFNADGKIPETFVDNKVANLANHDSTTEIIDLLLFLKEKRDNMVIIFDQINFMDDAKIKFETERFFTYFIIPRYSILVSSSANTTVTNWNILKSYENVKLKHFN